MHQNQYRRRSRRYCLAILATAVMILGLVQAAPATTCKAGSGRWAARRAAETGSDTWRFSEPGPLDVIAWTSGPNQTDGVNHGINRFWGGWVETKFDLGPPIRAKIYRNFRDSDGGPLPLFSSVFTRGRGRGRTVPGVLWGTNYKARWWLRAGGFLGTIAGAKYKAQCEALDPYVITPAQLAETGADAEDFFDLFFAAGLDTTFINEQGYAELNAYYDDALGTTNLLKVEIDRYTANVFSDNPAGLTLYLLDSLAEGPTQLEHNIITLPELQALIEGDLVPDGHISTPISIGIVWDSIPVPTIDMGYGEVARIRVESMVYEEGYDTTTAVGACTYDYNCLSYMTELECNAIGGTYQGDGTTCPPVCCEIRGDIDHSGLIPDIADLVHLVNYMFAFGPPPPCDEPYEPDCPGLYYAEADVDGSGGCTPDIADLVYLVNYMFQSGPSPVPCPQQGD